MLVLEDMSPPYVIIIPEAAKIAPLLLNYRKNLPKT